MPICAATRTPEPATADLFGALPDASSGEPAAPANGGGQTTQPPAEASTVGERYSQLWKSYCQALDAYMGELCLLAALERSFAPCEDYMAAVTVPPIYKRKDFKQKVALQIRDRLVRIASDRFAPQGANLSIDTEALSDAFPIEFKNPGGDARDLDDRYRIEFDPAACWRYLEETYGGNAGEELAWKQAALALVNSLNLYRTDEIKTVGGRLVIEIRVWTDTYSRGPELSYTCAESLREAFMALHAFAQWAGFDDLAREAYGAASGWRGHSKRVTSRAVYRLGDGCDYVTFLKSFNFRFSSQVAERMQVFVSTYAPRGTR